MKFILIKKTFNDSKMIIDVLKSLLGQSIKIEEDNTFLVIYHDEANVLDTNNSLLSLADDLMFNLYAYNSWFYNTDRELKIVKSLFNDSDLSNGIYDFKKLLLSKNNIKNKKEILEFILDNTGIDNTFIKGFVKNNLNVSSASKELYIHRNTMIYKLDKFKELTGFDLKNFIDAYIIYSLIENK